MLNPEAVEVFPVSTALDAFEADVQSIATLWVFFLEVLESECSHAWGFTNLLFIEEFGDGGI